MGTSVRPCLDVAVVCRRRGLLRDMVSQESPLAPRLPFPAAKGLHSLPFQLNVSAVYGMGGAFRGW